LKFSMSSLAKPSKDMRPWALWIWNLSIKRSEMLSQLRFFAEKGFGGVAIRCGQDMDPPFLSEEYFSLLGDLLKSAEEVGLSVRLCEDFSTSCSGIFSSQLLRTASLRAQRLSLVSSEVLTPGSSFEKIVDDPHAFICAAIKLVNGKPDFESVKGIAITKETISWKPPAGDWRVVLLKKVYVRSLGDFVPNPYNSQVIDSYIKTVLEEIKSRFSKFIPSVFEGIVTEMPAPLPHEKSIPWSDELATKYKSKHKKEMLPLILSAFIETEPAQAKLRVQLYTYLRDSLYDHVPLPLETWTKKYRLSQWVLCPERSGISENGIKHAQYQIPDVALSSVGFQNLDGTDHNFAGLRAMADLNTIQYRRKTITVVGRSAQGISSSTQDLKSEIDRNLHNGPSTTLIDGFFFNLDRRGHGSSAFSPFWYSSESESLKQLCEYSARMQVLVAQAHYARDVAVLMPSVAMMTELWVNSSESVPKALGMLEKIALELAQRGISFDIVSEELLQSCTVKANGEFGTADRIRKGSYRTLVVPQSWLISKSLLGCLERLAAKKGQILFVDDAPQGTLEDGISQAFSVRLEKMLSLDDIQTCTVKNLATALGTQVSPVASVAVQGKLIDDVWCSSASGQGYEAYLLQNMSSTQEHSTTVDLPGEKYACVLDSTGGSLEELDTYKVVDKIGMLQLNFLPKQSYMILLSSAKQAAAHKGKKSIVAISSRQKSYRVILKSEWEYAPGSFNVLPLAAWNARIGLSREFGGYSHFYEAYFEIKDLPTQCLLLSGDIPGQGWDGLEPDSRVEVTVNGNHIEDSRKRLIPPDTTIAEDPVALLVAANPYMKGASVYDIRGALDKGFNRVTIRTAGLKGEPPVIVYPPIVAGDFAIEKGLRGWTITMQRLPVGSDTWTNYGYPYLAGVGVYRQVFEIPAEYKQLILRCSQVSGTVQVVLNGKDLGYAPWSPFQFDVTAACESKRNELVLRVVNTIDNMLKLTRRPSGIRGEVHLDVY